MATRSRNSGFVKQGQVMGQFKALAKKKELRNEAVTHAKAAAKKNAAYRATLEEKPRMSMKFLTTGK